MGVLVFLFLLNAPCSVPCCWGSHKMWFSRRTGGKSICVYTEKQYMCKHLIDYMVALVCESLEKELHCFHLLSKTTKNSRRRKKQAFSLWLTPRFQQTGRTWATAGRRKKKWPNLRLIIFSFLIPGFSWVPKLTWIVLFQCTNQIQAAVWLAIISGQVYIENMSEGKIILLGE